MKDLYVDLMNLVKNYDAFDFKDFVLHDTVYRIFNYRLASWEEFKLPGALEARGIMFDISDESNPKIVCRPPKKFFNYEEGGVKHDQFKIGDSMVKMDGSLISSYMYEGNIYFKTKGSISSEQSNATNHFMSLEGNKQYKNEMEKWTKLGNTINCEYISPNNRIVIAYPKEDLIILNMRNNESGELFFGDKLRVIFKDDAELLKHMVDFKSFSNDSVNHMEFLNSIRSELEGEGYVTEIITPDSKDNYLVKIKTTKYVTLHKTKDNINSNIKLFESIIDEGSDDLRAIFFDDEVSLQKINDMENHVKPIFNNIVKTVETFYKDNKNLERKEFAIKIQKELPPFYLGLTMALYLNRIPEYKEFAKKHRVSVFNIVEEETKMNFEFKKEM